MHISRWFPVAVGFLLLAGVAQAEQVDNPQFQSWSKFAVGSSATLAGELASGGGPKMTMETTRKLVEKADDHVVIEISTSVNIMGQTHTPPARKLTVNAKTEQQDLKSLGDEKVEAAGKTFDCKVYEVTNKPDPQAHGPAAEPAKAKIWVSTDVPGGLVKMEADTARGTITQTLKSYNAG